MTGFMAGLFQHSPLRELPEILWSYVHGAVMPADGSRGQAAANSVMAEAGRFDGVGIRRGKARVDLPCVSF